MVYENPTYVKALVASEDPVKLITSVYTKSQPKYPINGAYYFSGLRAYWRANKKAKGACDGQNTLAIPQDEMQKSVGSMLTSYKLATHGNSMFVLCPLWDKRIEPPPSHETWARPTLVHTMENGPLWQGFSIEQYVGLSSVFFKGLLMMANPHGDYFQHTNRLDTVLNL